MSFPGVCGMGESFLLCLIKPTRDPRKIMDVIYDARIGGYLLSEAISYAHGIFLSSSNSYIQQRIIVFVGSVVVQQKHEVEEGGSVSLQMVVFQ
ncbi:dehydroascorbate reductase 2 [Tanacetum coccineum]